MTEDFFFKPEKKTIRMFDRRVGWRPMCVFDARSLSTFFSSSNIVEKLGFSNEARDFIQFCPLVETTVETQNKVT